VTFLGFFELQKQNNLLHPPSDTAYGVVNWLTVQESCAIAKMTARCALYTVSH